MAQPVGVALTRHHHPACRRLLKNLQSTWQEDLESLFHHTKDRFPDVVWELIGDDDEPRKAAEEIYGHKGVFFLCNRRSS
jgi:hypothetical protein